jgi:hypothetical protein
MTDKQSLYTGALTELGDRSVSTTENTTARRVLDNVYDKVVSECLKVGSWNFAMESVQLDADTGVETNFGDDEVFAMPSDFVRLHEISGDEGFVYPMNKGDYTLEQDYIVAPLTPIYMRYVSNDTGLGLDLGHWPPDFTRYVELELADRVCMRITQDKEIKQMVSQERDRARRRALNTDAMQEGSRYPPPGSWTQARYGRAGGWADRGRRNKLIG